MSESMTKTSSLRLYRCCNPACVDDATKPQRGHEFMSDSPAALVACDKCGCKRSDAKVGHLIGRLEMVHFDAPLHAELMIGVGYRACDPSKAIQAEMSSMPGEAKRGHAGTGHPSAVTCPACKESDAFKAAVAAMEE